MKTFRQGGHDVEHHFSGVVKMIGIGCGARRAITDHFEDVLGMVQIGAGSCQPYEQIVGLKLTASQPVTICHGFKGGDKLSPPLLQMLDSALRNFPRVRLESRRRGH